MNTDHQNTSDEFDQATQSLGVQLWALPCQRIYFCDDSGEITIGPSDRFLSDCIESERLEEGDWAGDQQLFGHGWRHSLAGEKAQTEKSRGKVKLKIFAFGSPAYCQVGIGPSAGDPRSSENQSLPSPPNLLSLGQLGSLPVDLFSPAVISSTVLPGKHVALFDISIWHIDCRYIDTFEKYRYRYGHFWKYRYRYR